MRFLVFLDTGSFQPEEPKGGGFSVADVFFGICVLGGLIIAAGVTFASFMLAMVGVFIVAIIALTSVALWALDKLSPEQSSFY